MKRKEHIREKIKQIRDMDANIRVEIKKTKRVLLETAEAIDKVLSINSNCFLEGEKILNSRLQETVNGEQQARQQFQLWVVFSV